MTDEQREPTAEEFIENADAYYDEQQIELNKAIAERAAQDEEFRNLLESDPPAAFEKAGLTDKVLELVGASQEEAGDEVSGHYYYYNQKTYLRTCRWYRRGLWWHWK